MQRKILIRYSEIALKGKNRHFLSKPSPAILSRRLKIQARKSSACMDASSPWHRKGKPRR